MHFGYLWALLATFHPEVVLHIQVLAGRHSASHIEERVVGDGDDDDPIFTFTGDMAGADFSVLTRKEDSGG